MATKAPPAYDMSLVDHGFEAKELKGLTYPLGDHAPGYGEIYNLAPDLGWTRMPVPGNLNHINLFNTIILNKLSNCSAVSSTYN